MQNFETLYDTYYNRIYGFLYRMCGDHALAEDLTQETFLQAYQSFHRFRGECSTYTWLVAIGKHIYWKYVRKHKTQMELCDKQPEPNHMQDPAEYVQKQYIQQSVRTMIAQLPEKYQDVVLLRIYAQLPFSEIALYLKISESSAKVIFFRAKKKLMEVLEHELIL